MVAKKGKLITTEGDGILEQTFQKYRLLKQEVDKWQQERKTYWLNTLNLADNPPYLPILDLPSEAIIELWQRLNTLAKVEISDSELRIMWEKFIKSENVMDADMSTRFQMALNGVAHIAGEMAYQKGVPASDDPQGITFCPVCGEASTLAVLTPPTGKRIMHCTMCDFEWSVKRVGCLYCGSEDSKQQIFLKDETFPGIEMAVCQICGQYFKEIDGRELTVRDYLWEDLRTLPLNYATELWLTEHWKKSNQIH